MKKALLIISILLSQAAAAELSSARQDELLYFLRQDCGSCHGMTLKGGLGPALLPETLAGKPRDYLVTSIMDGRKDTAMPGWKGMITRTEAVWLTEQLQAGSIERTEMAEGKTQ